MPDKCECSIIIPSYRGARLLAKLLPALRRQKLPPAEIIVIDSSSQDGTVELAHEYGCEMRVIPQSEFNHGGTRNMGAEMAKGRCLVFMTQDALPADETFLGSLLKPILSGRASAAYARQIPYPDATPLEVCQRTFGYPQHSQLKSINQVKRDGIRTFLFSNVASAVERTRFMEVGGFPESVILNEDLLLSARLQRAGYCVAYVAEACVYHSHNYSLGQQFRRYFDIGVALAQAAEELQDARAGGEGFRFVQAQMRYLVRERQWKWIAKGIAEAACKYTAFHLGKQERRLPVSMKVACSMHRGFWHQVPSLAGGVITAATPVSAAAAASASTTAQSPGSQARSAASGER